MRFTLSTLLLLWMCSMVQGQKMDADWYKETESHGIRIQNSFPKGGPYPGPTSRYVNHSYLVFFTRIVNETEKAVELAINFSADAIAIPHSPDTFMKLFLPSDTMTFDKQILFSYGITEVESFDKSTRFHRKLLPKEDCLFYVVAFFYQTWEGARNQKRGGNRAEFVLKGEELFYSMPPQIGSLPCGRISFGK